MLQVMRIISSSHQLSVLGFKANGVKFIGPSVHEKGPNIKFSHFSKGW